MKYQEVKDYYNKNFEKYHYNNDQLDLDHLFKFSKKLPNEKKVLDIGAGTGSDSLFFQGVSNKESVALDFSEEMVKFGKKLGVGNYVKGEFLDYKFNEKFDGVWCSSSIFSYYDEKDRADAYEKIYKLLNKDGVLGVVYKSSTSKNKKGNVKMYNFKELIEEVIELPFSRFSLSELKYPQNNWYLLMFRK